MVKAQKPIKEMNDDERKEYFRQAKKESRERKADESEKALEAVRTQESMFRAFLEHQKSTNGLIDKNSERLDNANNCALEAFKETISALQPDPVSPSTQDTSVEENEIDDTNDDVEVLGTSRSQFTQDNRVENMKDTKGKEELQVPSTLQPQYSWHAMGRKREREFKDIHVINSINNGECKPNDATKHPNTHLLEGEWTTVVVPDSEDPPNKGQEKMTIVSAWWNGNHEKHLYGGPPAPPNYEKFSDETCEEYTKRIEAEVHDWWTYEMGKVCQAFEDQKAFAKTLDIANCRLHREFEDEKARSAALDDTNGRLAIENQRLREEIQRLQGGCHYHYGNSRSGYYYDNEVHRSHPGYDSSERYSDYSRNYPEYGYQQSKRSRYSWSTVAVAKVSLNSIDIKSKN